MFTSLKSIHPKASIGALAAAGVVAILLIVNVNADTFTDPLPPGTDQRLDGPNVMRRSGPSEAPFLDSRIVILSGKRGEDGLCRTRVEFSAVDGDFRVQSARMLAVDLDTCEYEVEYGFPTIVPTRIPEEDDTSSEITVDLEQE